MRLPQVRAASSGGRPAVGLVVGMKDLDAWRGPRAYSHVARQEREPFRLDMSPIGSDREDQTLAMKIGFDQQRGATHCVHLDELVIPHRLKVASADPARWLIERPLVGWALLTSTNEGIEVERR